MWALLIATLLSILLSWGKNFMGFTNFFLDHFPGYNKFRAVSMTLVIAEVTMPLLGFLGLAEIAKTPDSFKKHQKKFFIALGVTAGFCLLFYLVPKVFFNFLRTAPSMLPSLLNLRMYALPFSAKILCAACSSLFLLPYRYFSTARAS